MRSKENYTRGDGGGKKGTGNNSHLKRGIRNDFGAAPGMPHTREKGNLVNEVP